jgi:hypothetical protein
VPLAEPQKRAIIAGQTRADLPLTRTVRSGSPGWCQALVVIRRNSMVPLLPTETKPPKLGLLML